MKIALPKTMGYKSGYQTTGNGRVDDDFRIPGYFITQSQVEKIFLALVKGIKYRSGLTGKDIEQIEEALAILVAEDSK